jgi:hypothetical protein
MNSVRLSIQRISGFYQLFERDPHFVKPDFIKEAHEGSYAIRIDIKYARGVRGMEHEETPIATETIKTMRIKSF